MPLSHLIQSLNQTACMQMRACDQLASWPWDPGKLFLEDLADMMTSDLLLVGSVQPCSSNDACTPLAQLSMFAAGALCPGRHSLFLLQHLSLLSLAQYFPWAKLH